MNHSLKYFFLILCLLLGASEVTRLWWFSRNQPKEQNPTFLKWTSPDSALDRNLKETRGGEVLAYDSGVQVMIQADESQISTDVIYLEYEKGNPRTLLDLFIHSPEICLPASGAKFIREFDHHRLLIANVDLMVRHWLFHHPISGESLHAFKLVWSRETELFKGALFHKDFINIRLKAATTGREFPASRMILAVITGAKNEVEAWQAFQRETLAHLKVEPSVLE